VLASQESSRLASTLEGWWRKKHQNRETWGERTEGDLIEEYFWDLVFEKEELERAFKQEGGEKLAARITQLEQVLQGKDVRPGKSGDPWLDDWDGEEDDDPPPRPPKPKPTKWERLTRG
jgi:hypothetical protein